MEELPSDASELKTFDTSQIVHKKRLFNELYNSLSSNPYFSAGAGLLGIGVAATISKRTFIIANTIFRRKFISVLEIDNTDRF